MEGYVRRIWGKFGVDKVSLVGKGIYLVRFATMENCEKVLQSGFQLFDSKPLIVKPWSPDINFSKDPIKKIPIWIQLQGLDVKYWGDKSLTKIVSQLGTMLKVDQATKNRDKLLYARVLVEVSVDQPFPEVIHFINEKGIQVDQQVKYDWLPISCTICGGMGHDKVKCTRRPVGHTRKVWIPKPIQQETTTTQPIQQVEPANVFVQATKFSRIVGHQLKPVVTSNTYQALSESNNEVECDVEESMKNHAGSGHSLGRGVASPSPNG
ncbi:uncharacterized protein [Spinacia oleracea]|uniref:DUF4283 domain-containing protein n=1 Tax=Spinacia oleracea TaxID=3562 RepID=A0ABM3R459_SPIOL|nr:uncharacterized protein LOC130465595 [Spinacia oleracea]